MTVLSLNIAERREVEWQGSMIATGFFKEPVDGEVLATKEGFEGDCIVNKGVHGGTHKAVYSYFKSHYDYWIDETGREDLTPGFFGENLTLDDLDEASINGGDKLQVGGALLQAVDLRLPCSKLGMRMGDDQFPGLFMESRRFGIYFSVLEEGNVKAGDSVSIVEKDPVGISMKKIISAIFDKDITADLVEKALSVESLAPDLKERLSKRLA